MKVLIIGNGGREHSMAWKMVQSPHVTQVFVAPGNAGTALEIGVQNIPIRVDDIDKLLAFVQEEGVALTLVGPEIPLVAGIVDKFAAAGEKIFGPTQAAAQLEGSKAFAKAFLQQHHIATARYETFTEIAPALDYIRQQGSPIVIKADGLAAGKGVVVAMTRFEAENAVRDMLSGNIFGESGHRIVIEEFLQGEEASFIVMVDGDHVLPMATSQDHKRVGDNDSGPNTGGMGAYSPAPVIDNHLNKHIMEQIIWPTVKGMAKDGNKFVGFLYAGLMIDQQGQVKVIEFNCRMGDPETQPILMRLESDFFELCMAGCEGRLNKVAALWDKRSALGVVLAAGGYPGAYRQNDPIRGLTKKNRIEGKVFHSGTALEGDQVVTQGGRVLCVTALGEDIIDAQRIAYQLANTISFEGHFYRQDIGYLAVDRLQDAKNCPSEETES